MLLTAEAKKDMADKGGHTALWAASSKGRVEIVRSLLEAGANKDVADHVEGILRRSCEHRPLAVGGRCQHGCSRHGGCHSFDKGIWCRSC